MKYRKRPVVIEAEQYSGPQVVPLDQPYPTDVPAGVTFRATNQADAQPCVETLEGPLWVTVGDWIITGVKGERYPCKPDIFEATYEPA